MERIKFWNFCKLINIGGRPWVIPFCFLIIGSISCKKNADPDPENKKIELSLPIYFGQAFLPPQNPTTIHGVKLGRMLFYEKKLSKDNSISCGSCHIQKYAFSDTARFSLGVGSSIGTRNAMSLANLIWQKAFFWDNRAKTLEDQALLPIQDIHEMQESLENVVIKLQNDPIYPGLFKSAFGDEVITKERLANAISQFERTLISSNSKFDRYLQGKIQLTKEELNGKNLFYNHPDPILGVRGGNCGDCHAGNLQLNSSMHNNGLDTDASMFDLGLGKITLKQEDNGRFKVPSLRNIAISAPYMHDGRLKTLEEVLDHYNEHILASKTLDPLIINASNEIDANTLMLSTQEKKDIVAFLKTLTDSSFINNPDFSNPFEK